MKKILIWILLITVALFCFAGCSDNVPPEDDVYKHLGDLVSGVDGFSLSVSTAAGGEILTSNYDVAYTEKGYQVTYSYEVLNPIDLTYPSVEYKSNRTGTAVVESGEIKSHTGDEIDVLPGKLTLHFDASYFSDAYKAEGSFKARVTDPEAFFGKNEEITDMRVEISHTQDAFISIVIRYIANSSEVQITYTFD